MSAPSTTLTTASFARASIPFREPEDEADFFDPPPFERELFDGPPEREVFDEPPPEREEDPDFPDAFLPPDAPVFEPPDERVPPEFALLADDLPLDDLVDDLLLPDDEPRLAEGFVADDLPDERDDEAPPFAFDDEPVERVPPDPLDFDELPPARDDPLFALDERDDVDPPFALDARDDVAPDFDDPLFELPLRVDDVDLPDVAPAPRKDPLFDEPDFVDDAPDFELFVDDDFELDDLLPPLLPDDEVLVGIISSLSEIGIRNQFHATAKSTTQFVRCITFFALSENQIQCARNDDPPRRGELCSVVIQIRSLQHYGGGEQHTHRWMRCGDLLSLTKRAHTGDSDTATRPCANLR